MPKTNNVHVIGNGDSWRYYDPNSKGIKLTCNLPPMHVPDSFGTCMVDFKMMHAIMDGSVQVPGDWILGYRPKVHMHTHPPFHMKHARQIKGYYTHLPDYVDSYTDFSCGHMATHFAASNWTPKKIHMYGFNSMFDFDLISVTDMYLSAVRDDNNVARLTNNWRGIWPNIFKEFSETEFVIYHKHSNIKFELPDNVTIKTP